ncbi:mannan endo-1,4-beta-mannosidase 6 isoform X2 [Fagus crenata]
MLLSPATISHGTPAKISHQPRNYIHDRVCEAVDFVVSEAKKFKIRLILSLTNNWDAYGGKPQYTVLNRVNTLTNITYKDDPTIFACELMNEPRCTSDPSGNKLQICILGEMAIYVKSIDPKHLVEIGLEGFYGPSTPDRVQFNPNTYAQQKSLGMPIMFAEFGVSAKDPGYNLSFQDTLLSTVYKTILNAQKSTVTYQLECTEEYCNTARICISITKTAEWILLQLFT